MPFHLNPEKDWQALGKVAPIQLIDARLQLHHAVQIVSVLGRYLLPARKDDSHASLTWSRKYQAWLGEPIGASGQLRGGLHPGGFNLMLINDVTGAYDDLHLDEFTIGEAFFWMERKLEENGVNIDDLILETPYELPHHDTGEGDPFRFYDLAPFRELANYYSNAQVLLEQLAAQDKRFTPVRCWPHHFDLAALLTLKEAHDPENTESLGIGLSPGDENIAEPYFYLSVWPYPEIDLAKLPPLPGGQWQTEGWVGALLTADQISRETSAAAQARLVADFILIAINELAKQLNYTI